jgi:peptide/nickel transport system substrate-binding protein
MLVQLRPKPTVAEVRRRRPLDSPRRRTLFFTAVVAAATMVVSACGGSANSTSATATKSDTLTVVTPDTAIAWALDNGFGGLEAANNLHATLLRKPYVKSSKGDSYQQDVYKFEPYLAKSYTVSKDGLVYTFTLADAVSAAGNHLTSDDVIWSYKRKFDTPTSVSPAVMSPEITDVDKQFKKIDQHTFSITLANSGYGITLLALISDLTAQIYDSTLLKQHVTASDPYAVKWSAENPNYGFGPYMVKSYQPGVQVLLTANPNYSFGAPKIKNVLIKIVPDAGTRANAVKTGDAGLAEGLNPSDLVALKTGTGTKIGEVDNPNAYMMIPLLTNKAPFNNEKVREAFAWAVPYQQIIDNVYHGLAVRQGSSFLLRTAPGYDGAGFTPFAYDTAKAKALLTGAGLPNGVSFTLTVSAAEPDMREAAVQIQTFAKKAGFNITINQVPAAAFGQGRTDKTFQAFILRDYAITMTPPYQLLVYTAKGGGNNLADWRNTSFYAAYDKGNAQPDALSPTAGKLWNAAEQIFINTAPIVFIAQIQPSVAMRSTVDGYAWRSDNWVDYSNLSLG